MARRIRRLAIVNRGEAAMRALHAVAEHNGSAASPITTIALYTDPDRDAMFVWEADEAVRLGPATVVDPVHGSPRSSYLDLGRLEEVMVGAGVDAAWVGWGFVAERPEFAALCERLGVVFVGPPSAVMAELGDKISSKRIAAAAGCPVAPWSEGAVATEPEARLHAQRLGTPLMVKATAGGGGRGIRVVRDPAGLAVAFESARAEAAAAFGDPTVFLEKLVEGARHVEVQVIADDHGTVWACGVRDCSAQRRNQKVVEESSSPALDAATEQELRDAAVRLCRRVGYRNAGTVEFLYHEATGELAFLEVNTRLQVEHPVTELVTGLDLVKLQLHVAQGGRLDGDPPRPHGHAIEARLCAEDPERDFAPAPGRIRRFRLPTGPGIRVDTGFREGDVVAADFDSMIAKVLAWGGDRTEALARLRKALLAFQVVLDGGTTNKSFLLALLETDAMRAGSLDVGWLDRGAAPVPAHAEVALFVAGIEAYEQAHDRARSQFLASAFRGRPQVAHRAGFTGELRVGGQAYEVHVRKCGPTHYRLRVDGVDADVDVRRLDEFERRVALDGRTHRVVVAAHGPDVLVEVDGAVHRVSRDDGGIVRAPAPAVVVAVTVAPGDRVSEGDRLAVVESMKTETSIAAPFAGTVRSVLVAANSQVDAGAPLLALEPARGAGSEREGVRLDPAVLSAPRGDGELARLDLLRALVLGYDVAASDMPAPGHGERDGDDAEVVRTEDEILGIFADLAALGRPQRDADDGDTIRSSQQYFFTYLRSIETEGAGLPEGALDRIRAALSHYGIGALARSHELEDALFWIASAHQRMDAQVAPLAAILERRLDRPGHDGIGATDEYRGLLDRLVDATKRSYPGLAELAREVRYREFEMPLLTARRAQVYADVDSHLAALGRDPAGSGRDRHMAALVDCPLPLRARLTARVIESQGATRDALVEALCRRYYRDRNLGPFTFPDTGIGTACSAYEHEGRRIHVIVAVAADTGIMAAAQRLVPLLDDIDGGDDVVVDFHLLRTRNPGMRPERVRRYLRWVMQRLNLPRVLRRVAVMIAPAAPDAGGQQYLTFRPDPTSVGTTGYVEDELTRGLHPMIAKRLDLWRLANFEAERLPWFDDVNVFRCTARDNPRDARLFALAEVRDLTPVRDESGVVVGLPELERLLLGCLEAIRRHRLDVPVRERPVWNRVILHVRPPFELGMDDVRRVARRMASATEGIGIEMVLIHARFPDPSASPPLRDVALRFSNPSGSGFEFAAGPPPTEPLQPLDDYTKKVVECRRRGFVYVYEFIKMLTPAVSGRIPAGDFVEYDLDAAEGRLVPAHRPAGMNRAGVVVGVIRNRTRKHPEGMERVFVGGDPTRSLGAIAEDEARRIVAAIDLAEELGVPVEWFALSAGARISMESGTENMDWIGRVLRRIVEFTQAGGEINVVVCGINVGAQPYWNAEATMLAHTRGILVMTPDSAMVLTGKRALDFSGGVSAEDNFGIGGYERIMGPNGEAQYWAPDLRRAAEIMHRHYDHTYVAPGEASVRRAPTTDPADRDVRAAPHAAIDGCEFGTVGEVFSDTANPDRKKPFDIRSVMRAVSDADADPLERWRGMDKADTAVVWDTHLGGIAVSVVGIESRPLLRQGFVPADGPDAWTPGTLFPQSSKKVARAINAASGNRPVVILANLAGFDGSPESLRNLQLEHGAEIGRAVVNFDGPIVFCVVSRYHGGAFVVFSATLNEGMQVLALEGSRASVIGGAPAAAVVFAGDVADRTRTDPRVRDAERARDEADPQERARLRAALDEVVRRVRSEKLGEVAAEFDAIHSIERAQKVGSVHEIVPVAALRPALIEAVERGLRR